MNWFRALFTTCVQSSQSSSSPPPLLKHSPSGIRSLCIHYPHMKDVWISYVLPFLLPQESDMHMLYFLLRFEYDHRKCRVLVQNGFIRGDSIYAETMNGTRQLHWKDDLYNEKIQFCAGFLPSTFGHFNVFCHERICRPWREHGKLYHTHYLFRLEPSSSTIVYPVGELTRCISDESVAVSSQSQNWTLASRIVPLVKYMRINERLGFSGLRYLINTFEQ
jgi:hypothetical protein